MLRPKCWLRQGNLHLERYSLLCVQDTPDFTASGKVKSWEEYIEIYLCLDYSLYLSVSVSLPAPNPPSPENTTNDLIHAKRTL